MEKRCSSSEASPDKEKDSKIKELKTRLSVDTEKRQASNVKASHNSEVQNKDGVPMCGQAQQLLTAMEANVSHSGYIYPSMQKASGALVYFPPLHPTVVGCGKAPKPLSLTAIVDSGMKHAPCLNLAKKRLNAGCGFDKSERDCHCWLPDTNSLKGKGLGWEVDGYVDAMTSVHRGMSPFVRILQKVWDTMKVLGLLANPSADSMHIRVADPKTALERQGCCAPEGDHVGGLGGDACNAGVCKGLEVLDVVDPVTGLKEKFRIPERFALCRTYEQSLKGFGRFGRFRCPKTLGEVNSWGKSDACNKLKTKEACTLSSHKCGWCSMNTARSKCRSQADTKDVTKCSGLSDMCNDIKAKEACISSSHNCGWCGMNRAMSKCRKKAEMTNMKKCSDAAKTIVAKSQTNAVKSAIRALVSEKYHTVFDAVWPYLKGLKFEKGFRVFVAAFTSHDKKLKQSADMLVGDMRTAFLVKLKLTNPCSFECKSVSLLSPIFDSAFTTFVGLPNGWENPFKKRTQFTQWNPWDVSTRWPIQAFLWDRFFCPGGDQGGAAAIWSDRRPGPLTPQEYQHKLDVFWQQRTDDPTSEDFDLLNAKGVTCKRRKGNVGCEPGTQAYYTVNMKVDQKKLSERLKGSAPTAAAQWGALQVEDIACSMYVSLRIDICSSCCCREGVVKAQVSSGLISSTPNGKCETWFTCADVAARVAISITRAVFMTGFLKSRGCVSG